jgi:cob(I)alamin adenosyltransferase
VCRRYAFLYEEAMPGEVKELKAAVKKANSETEKRRAQKQLSKIQQSLKVHEDRTLLQQVSCSLA